MILVEDGVDAGLLWHSGDPYAEQKAMLAHEAVVALMNREVFEVRGPDRLTWLHALTSQAFEGLKPGVTTSALILSPTGHIEHVMTGADDGAAFIAFTEPGRRDALMAYLSSMIFATRVEVREREDAVWWADGRERIGGDYADRPQAGLWAYEALRIASQKPRIFVETDHRTIPNEIGLFGTHLDKGCYRGQETVARVQNLGRPPRRLVALHIDGSAERLPAHGVPLMLDDKEVGWVGSSARHYELGPIGLGLVRRNTPTDATLHADGIAVAQETIVDPDVGLHFRAKL